MSRSPSDVTLQLKLDGPLVDEHRLPISELTRVTKALRGALRSVALVLSDHGTGVRAGRAEQHIEKAVDLVVVAPPSAGSFVLDLELPELSPPEQEQIDEGLDPGLPAHVLNAFVSGLSMLDDQLDELPAGFDHGVLRAVQSFRQSLNRGVTSIDLMTTDRRLNGQTQQARIDTERVDAAKRLTQQPLKAHAVAEGMLEMFDRPNLEGRIDRPPAASVLCRFDESIREEAIGAAWKFVRVTGMGEFPPGENVPRRITVTSVKVLYESMPFDFDDKVFWQTKSVQTLAAEQRSEPFTFDEIDDSDPWRDADEAAALIDAIHEGD